ncbi:MAG TPA: glycosyltransferase family 2 protein, partial [Terriglobales bacterium]
MTVFHWIAGTILALVWISRVIDAALGMRKVPDTSQPEWDLKLELHPRLSIIVPARNEEHGIAETLACLLALDYENYEIIAVDDRSTDQTGKIIDEIAANPKSQGRLKAIHIDTLPSGWIGKTHAMWSAARRATGDWLLFTDADVLFRPDSLRRAIACAEKMSADHLVLVPTLVMHGPGERMMIAFFQTLFVFAHRPWKVADPAARDHMGVGAFNLVRREAYEGIGTYQALRMDVLDDMKLGKVIKNRGYAQRSVLGPGLVSVRWAKGASGVVRNLTKNVFALLSFQWLRVMLGVIGLVYFNLLPFVGVVFARGRARLPYSLALAAIF